MPTLRVSLMLLFLLVACLVTPASHAQTYSYTLLHTFIGADGAVPAVNLTLDSADNIYGAANSGGGSSECGTIFKIDKTGAFSVLYSFTGGADGCNPEGGLLRYGGNIYGVAAGGGDGCPGGCGTIFQLNKKGILTPLYSFTGGTDGADPGFGLVRDPAGNFYGVTSQGGYLACDNGQGCGTVFQLDTSNQLNVLYRFTGGPDGAIPFGELSRDAAGNLYGNTEFGGDSNCVLFAESLAGCGTVFKLDSSSNLTVLHPFSGGADGAYPSGVIRAGSNLYGTTQYGGGSCFQGTVTGCGVVFKIDGKHNLSVLHNFTGGADGAESDGGGDLVVGFGLTRDKAGNLYGATVLGGDLTCATGSGYGCGTVFMLDSDDNLAALYDFTGGTDGTPSSYGTDLVRDKAGNLYGVTYPFGDLNNMGTVFKVAP
jgi:uncharacterized repeat protein (TIGR03803 family)